MARGELRDALKRPLGGRRPPDDHPEEAEPRTSAPPGAEHGPEARPEPEPERAAPRARGRAATTEADVRRWYANLELPYGASADEVRAAYRRLVRRYHPDRHHGDAEAEKVASELAQGLRRAYEGLLAHLS